MKATEAALLVDLLGDGASCVQRDDIFTFEFRGKTIVRTLAYLEATNLSSIMTNVLAEKRK